jgi:hypothetical protein
MVTTEATSGLKRERVRASHQADGRADDQQQQRGQRRQLRGQAHGAPVFGGHMSTAVAEVADHLLRRGRLQVVEQAAAAAFRRRPSAARRPAGSGPYRSCGTSHHEPAAGLPGTATWRQRHEADLGVAGADELEGLRDALAGDQLGRQRLRSARAP